LKARDRLEKSYHKPDDWQSAGSIHWTKANILWVLKNLSLLRCGIYPSDYKETGWIDPRTLVKRGNPKAPFIEAIELVTEIERRLERCRKDGMILEFVYTQIPVGEAADVQALQRHVARLLNIEPSTVERSCRRALAFIEGFNFPHNKGRRLW
jgi:hypothetical protein